MFFCFFSLNKIWQNQGRRQGGGLRGLQPPPHQKKREEKKGEGKRERERKKKEKGSWTRHSKNMWSWASIVAPLTTRRPWDPPTIMASAFRAFRQPPLSQNPAYAPGDGTWDSLTCNPVHYHWANWSPRFIRGCCFPWTCRMACYIDRCVTELCLYSVTILTTNGFWCTVPGSQYIQYIQHTKMLSLCVISKNVHQKYFHNLP